eukprot:GFKZ01012338.1.p1 GENE.GFKZ01012338.1~~GFKZ01012338.1.p1  ORF type:complete len:591 (-),score=70.87 GFKZ01012338.1:572-2344(-)
MELHAEYFLKCSEAAKWLNTPKPVNGIPKEFLDGAHAISTSMISPASAFPPTHPAKRTSNSKHSASTNLADTIVGRKGASASATSVQRKGRKSHAARPPTGLVASDVRGLERGFAELEKLAEGKALGDRSLLYVPVELHEHFVFGVVLGCVVPPPDGVKSDEWVPLVNRFVLDAGRKCCLMFSYFAEGSIAVSVDCFDEVGDHFREVTFFEPTPVVGVFPRGIRGRMQIFERRDCPKCSDADITCRCPVNERIEAIVKLRERRVFCKEAGPAHAGSSYKDDRVTIQTYPYWAQVLDEYKWSRTGNYYVQVRYTPAHARPVGGRKAGVARSLAYRERVVAEGKAVVDKMLRFGLFNKGVSALKAPATDVRWETSSTVSVNAVNEVKSECDPVNAVCFTDWHKLPGFQEDYLLVAPSNIVSGAHAREELARAEAARLEAEARAGVPVLPSWASGRAGVVEHIIAESGPELDMCTGPYNSAMDDEFAGHISQDFHAQMLRQIPLTSVGTVMRPVGIEVSGGGVEGRSRRQGVDVERRRHSHEVARVRIVEGARRSSVDSGMVRKEVEAVVESNRKRRNVYDGTCASNERVHGV